MSLIFKALLTRVLEFLIDSIARRVADVIIEWLEARVRTATAG
jgi:hypothetical protein